MRQEDLCPGTGNRIYSDDNITAEHSLVSHNDADYGQKGMRPKGIKRIRIKCPRCGRRVLSSVSTCHDGCCARHYLPPHKPRGWCKKPKLVRKKVRK